MIRLLTIPFIGLFYFAQSIRAGFESKFGELIVRMTWVGRQRKLYMLLTLPYVLFVAVGSGAAESGKKIGTYISSLDIYLQLEQVARLLFATAFGVGDYVVAVVLALGIRRFLASEPYANELRATPNSRREIFQNALAGYFPFLLFLFFVARPFGLAIGESVVGADGFSAFLDSFFYRFIGVPVDYGGYRYLGNFQSIILGLTLNLVSWLSFLCFLYLRVFSIVVARTAYGGFIRAVVYTTLLGGGFVCIMIYLSGNLYGFSHGDGFFWGLVAPHIFPILGLGILWYLAQSRFERDLLPTEEGECL